MADHGNHGGHAEEKDGWWRQFLLYLRILWVMMSWTSWDEAKRLVGSDKAFIKAEKKRKETAELRAVQRERSFLKWARRALVVGGLWLIIPLLVGGQMFLAVFVALIGGGLWVGIHVADADAFLRETEIMNSGHHHGDDHGGGHAPAGGAHGQPAAGHKPPANSHATPPATAATPPPVPQQTVPPAGQTPPPVPKAPVVTQAPPPIPTGAKKTT